MSRSGPKDGKYQVLIVDDHALVRHGLSELISDEPDLEVCGEAADADEAKHKIATTCPNLVIVDISLKTSNGLDLIKRIRVKYPEIKILVSSMHDDTVYAERALAAGALGYVNKQEATDLVIDAIRQVLTGRIFLHPETNTRLLRRVLTGSGDQLKPSIESLSDRELEVFELIGHGIMTREIAKRLHLSVKTVETYREHIKSKLNLTTAAELTRHAVHWVLEDC